MEQTFAKVERELDELERAFESGEMNAFGNRETQLDFSSSFQHISELETEVFFRTCSILRFCNSQENNPFTNVMTLTKADGNDGSTGEGEGLANNGGIWDGADRRENGSRLPHLMNNNSNSTFHHSRFYPSPGEDASFSDTVRSRGTDPPSHSLHTEENDEEDVATQDKAFVNVTHHFDVLELEFDKVSHCLHDVYQEVIRIDSIADKLNSGGDSASEEK